MLSRDWLKAFLPVGVVRKLDGDRMAWSPVGAGTLVVGDGVIWFVTAAHVVRDQEPPFAVMVPTRAGDAQPVDLTGIQATTGTSWQFSGEHDLAATLMPLAPDHDVRAIERKLFLSFEEAVPSMPCFTIGCPHGVLAPGKTAPLVQDGVIAGTGDASKIYTTAPTFPGNSGGPLLAVRVPYTTSGAVTVGRPTVLLAGVMIEYALFHTEDPALSPRLPALHLGVAVSADAIAALLGSPGSQAQEALAKGKAAP